MPLIRKKDVVAVDVQNDTNINQGNEESPIANDKLEEEVRNKDVEESNDSAITTDHSNDDNVMSTRNKHQISNLNNKKQSYLMGNRVECIKNKTHMKNRQRNKVAYLISRDVFSNKKPTMNDKKI